MWYLHLKDSSLSAETVNICLKNRIYTAQDLLELYREKEKFNNIRGLKSDQEMELHIFCSETLQYFSSFIESGNTKDLKTKPKRKEKIMKNTSIPKLCNMGLISKQLGLSLMSAGIDDLEGMKLHYLDSDGFLDIRNIGKLKNDEATEFIEAVEVEGFVPPETGQNTRAGLFMMPGQTDRGVLASLLRMKASMLKDVIVSYFENEILNEADDDKIAEKLNTVFYDKDAIRGVGTTRFDALKQFLNEFKGICEDPKKKKAFETAWLLYRCRSFINRDREPDEIEDLSVERPLQIIDFIIQNSRSIKPRELFLLENVKATKIYDHSQNLKFIEAVDDLSEIHGKQMSLNGVRTLAFRLRDSLQELLDDILVEIPELKDKIMELIPVFKDYVFIDKVLLDELNEKNHTQFNLYFFDLLLSRIYQSYSSLYNMSNNGFDFLCYIKGDKVENEDLLQEFTTRLRDIIRRDSPNSYEIMAPDLIPDHTLKIDPDQFLKDLLHGIDPDIAYNGSTISFPATREGAIRVIDMIIPVLEAHGEAMQYDELLEAFDKTYPDYKRTSYRSLRDALDNSELTLSLGGLSNHFILASWADKYHIGSIKNLIIDYLEKTDSPVHYYQIYCDLQPERPGLSRHNVLQTLSHLSGQVFKSHNQGFYSLKKRKIESAETYSRIHQGIYEFIREHLELLNDEEKLIDELMVQYPGYKRIQFKYAIYHFRNKMN